MATTSSNPGDPVTTTETDSLEPEDAIRDILKHNPELAEDAYNRTFGYRQRIRTAVANKHDLWLKKSTVRDVVVDTNRLGLLNTWAELSN